MALDERKSGPPRCQAAFTTLLDFRQLVHTVMRTVPAADLRAHVLNGWEPCRRVRLCAWLMLFPETGLFPQISQTFAMRLSVLVKLKNLNIENTAHSRKSR